MPGWSWQVLDGSGPTATADPWDTLCRASVVVSHGGLNALAEIAAARRPTVVIPQDRPFGEQTATAAALHTAGVVASAPAWPDAERWPALLAEAAALDPTRWSAWSHGDGAARAADVVRRVAARGPSW